MPTARGDHVSGPKVESPVTASSLRAPTPPLRLPPGLDPNTHRRAKRILDHLPHALELQISQIVRLAELQLARERLSSQIPNEPATLVSDRGNAAANPFFAVLSRLENDCRKAESALGITVTAQASHLNTEQRKELREAKKATAKRPVAKGPDGKPKFELRLA
jgi:hypothetical protein